MSTLVSAQRITVVTHDRLEEMLVKQFAKLGAKGYTSMDCRGRGEHELIQDVFSGATRVRIETIVPPKVAEDIMKFLGQPQFEHQPIMACVETVQVGMNVNV
jgi:nitrogen regulatory protein P-II 2